MFGNRKKPSILNRENQPLSDELLIQRYKETGDVDIVGILFDRYAHLAYSVCLKYLKDEEESRDAAMAVFEQLFTSLKKHEINTFRTWLHSVCRNHCLMKLRHDKVGLKIKNKESKEKQAEIMESEDLGHLSGEEDFQVNQGQLLNALEILSIEQRTCIELMYLNNKSYKEISDLTGYDFNQVKSFIQNGKRNLKLILEKKK